MQVVVRDLLTSYYRSGTGKQLLILHGWGDASANWQSFAMALSKHYDVIVPDLPGFGGSQSPQIAWGLDDYAAFVAAFVTKLKLKPAILLGHSNGGAIAIRGLAQEKLTADSLVLLASAGIRNEYKGRNHVLRIVTKTGKAVTAPLPTRVKKKLQRQLYSTVGSDMLVAEHLQETFKKVITDDVRTDAALLSIPSLLVYGEADEQTPLRYGQILHESIPDSTLEVLPGVAHFLYRDNQAVVLKLVEDFIA
jgi:pimeloyl-ACP methyl ester carboxylesterase